MARLPLPQPPPTLHPTEDTWMRCHEKDLFRARKTPLQMAQQPALLRATAVFLHLLASAAQDDSDPEYTMKWGVNQEPKAWLAFSESPTCACLMRSLLLI